MQAPAFAVISMRCRAESPGEKAASVFHAYRSCDFVLAWRQRLTLNRENYEEEEDDDGRWKDQVQRRI